MFNSLNYFYLLCTPGSEEILIREIELRFPSHQYMIVQVNHGGVEIKADINFACNLALKLKTLNRVIMRIDEFKCRDFPKLYKKVANIPWKNFIDLNKLDHVKVKATSHKSRLLQTNRIEETIKKSILKSIKAQPPKKSYNSPFPPEVVVSVHSDSCRININLTGELLHKRHQSNFINQAPLRETIAASILFKVFELIKRDHLELIDPMCGSGSFLTELASINQHHSRNFDFLKNQSFETIKCQEISSPFHSIIGQDINPSLIEELQKRQLLITFKEKNFFDNDFKQNQVLIMNPPYGKRLKIEDDFYPRMIKRITDSSSEDAFILSDRNKLSHFKSILSLKHGGIKVHLHHYQKINKYSP